MAARRARKTALRRAAAAARDELSPSQRAAASDAAAERLRRLPELRRARVVALYSAHGSEVDLTALIDTLRARGVTTGLPRVVDDRIRLVAATATTPLEPGYRTILEPTGASVHLDAVDVVVLPGVAFDPVGGRLGRGGGHYDRLLAQLPEAAVRVGVGFACQLVPAVPREAHDQVVDVVVTDRATYRTHARR